MLKSVQLYLDKGLIPIPVRTTEKKYLSKSGLEITLSRKSPFGKGWQNTTKENAIQLFTARRANKEPVNIGILTGKPSGIFVVDIDKQDGGVEAWNQVIKGHDYQTLNQKTPSGGFHYIYKYDERM